MKRAQRAELRIKREELPLYFFIRNALDERFAAEASKNLENAESPPEQLVRGRLRPPKRLCPTHALRQNRKSSRVADEVRRRKPHAKFAKYAKKYSRTRLN